MDPSHVQGWFQLLIWLGSNSDSILSGLLLVVSVPITLASIICRVLPPPRNPNSFAWRLRHVIESLAQNKGWATNSWVVKAQQSGVIEVEETQQVTQQVVVNVNQQPVQQSAPLNTTSGSAPMLVLPPNVVTPPVTSIPTQASTQTLAPLSKTTTGN